MTSSAPLRFAIGRDAFTTFGVPPDGASWIALGAACALLAACVLTRRTLARMSRRISVRSLALGFSALAAVLSWGYVRYYLRGGPRIIDATSYLLEARAFSRGYLAFPIPFPTGSFRGRFLISPPGAQTLSVIFPPGWPALLAAGVRIGAPLAIGPVLAALLVMATAALAWQLFRDKNIVLGAIVLSALCAALRYHTADTMSHGFSALLLCLTIHFARSPSAWSGLLLGLSCGWLCATRPITGVVAVAVSTILFASELRKTRESPALPVSAVLVGLLPGLCLLALHQHAATGSWLTSSQYYYYSVADGPPGCFRYGFGSGIGCVHEHGDVVKASLAQGFTLGRALITTLQRVALNAIDIGNAEPLAVLLVVAAVLGRKDPRIHLLVVSCLLVIAAYAPFYFPGSYPGGGARLLADMLPLEHVLAAFAAARLRLTRFLAPVALAGFAVHASFAHCALAAREGGRPMYEPKVLAAAGVRHGLVFVNTDHAFNLGFDPSADAARQIFVARSRNDAHDTLLWVNLGRPPTYRYDFDPFAPVAKPQVKLYAPAPVPLRFEAEAEWPPLWVKSGSVYPKHTGQACTSQGRGLQVVSPVTGQAYFAIQIVSPSPGRYAATFAWSRQNGSAARVHVRLAEGTWEAVAPAGGPGCWNFTWPALDLRAGAHSVELTFTGESGLFDYLELTRLH